MEKEVNKRGLLFGLVLIDLALLLLFFTILAPFLLTNENIPTKLAIGMFFIMGFTFILASFVDWIY